MKKTTKVGSVLVAAMMTVGFMAGCGTTPQETASTAGEKVYKVGVVQYMDHPSLDNCREGFVQGLAAQGIEEGKNLKLTVKSAQGDSAMNTQIAQTFVNDKMDLVSGIATPSAMALYNVAYDKKIPVVFNAISDPVAAGLAKSETEAMPGISGISDLLPVADQLQLIRELLPEAKKIGIIYTTSEANSVSTIDLYKKLAGQYGFEIVEKGITNPSEVAQAADLLVNQVDCISNLTDNNVVASLAVVLEKANAKKIPVFGSEEEQVTNGCVASAGLDYIALGKQAGEMAAKVLKGTDVSTIPYETMKESSITVNPDVAGALGITIPENVLEKAK